MMARSIWLASLAAALALAACGKKDAEAPAADATAETQVAEVAEGDAAANDAKLADANLAASEKFLSENGAPIIAKLRRCIDGKDGRQLLGQQARLRETVAADRRRSVTPEARAMAALVEARRRGLSHDHEDVMS